MRHRTISLLCLVAVVTLAMSTAAQRTLEQMLNNAGQIIMIPFTETSVPDVSASGKCTLYGDSTAHELRVSCNAGPYRALVLGVTPTPTPTPTLTPTATLTPTRTQTPTPTPTATAGGPCTGDILTLCTLGTCPAGLTCSGIVGSCTCN